MIIQYITHSLSKYHLRSEIFLMIVSKGFYHSLFSKLIDIQVISILRMSYKHQNTQSSLSRSQIFNEKQSCTFESHCFLIIRQWKQNIILVSSTQIQLLQENEFINYWFKIFITYS
ncbi:hypothetical protein pb186bvf_002770 [Paramecium bursaria]